MEPSNIDEILVEAVFKQVEEDGLTLNRENLITALRKERLDREAKQPKHTDGMDPNDVSALLAEAQAMIQRMSTELLTASTLASLSGSNMQRPFSRDIENHANRVLGVLRRFGLDIRIV